MSLERMFKSVIVGVGALLLTAPAYAAPITFEFSGTVDLSSEGGPALNTFSGSLTWDSDNVTPTEEDPGVYAQYDPLSYTLIFNGVDYTAPVIGDGTGSGVVVADDTNPLTEAIEDVFAFFFEFRPPFQIGGVDGDLALIGVLTGPTTMFSSTALPGNLDFLGELAATYSLWQYDPDTGETEPILLDLEGTLVVSDPNGPGDPSAPEPAALALTAFGLAGAFARARRARRSTKVN